LAVLLLLHGFVNGAFAEKEKSRPRSFEQIKSAAEAGDSSAQYQLGVSYFTGAGTGKDSTEAVKWLRKAADQNNAEAQGLLGHCYAAGEGVPRDAAEAVKWYRKAAEQGVARAQGALGSCYFYGEGVTKNDAEAVNWYRKAAEQGVPEAHAIWATAISRAKVWRKTKPKRLDGTTKHRIGDFLGRSFA
jgi:TPR repeat protein